MSLSDIYAIAIATGYAAVAVGLWRFRAAFVGVRSFAILLFPLLGLWVIFYGSLPFVNEQLHATVYVWLSRTAHTMAIMLIFLTVKLGSEIVKAIEAANAAD